jgi:hypothetical protein
MAKVITLKAKNYTPNSQIVGIKKTTAGFTLVNLGTSKENTELELFKDKSFKSDEIKDFKDKKEFTSVEFRIIEEQKDLVLVDSVKVIKFDETATPMFTEIATNEVNIPFSGNDEALDKLLQDAIFPFIVLKVKTPNGDALKNDIASLKRDTFVKLVQKAEGEAFTASLELDNAINQVDLSKLRVFEGSKMAIDANSNQVISASTVGYDSSKEINWKLQIKFRGFEVEDKGTAKVAQ